jgi:hypothetical protein
MKNLFLILFGCLAIQSCDPPRDCTDPKCADSPILVKLNANLSDTNKVLRIGDTLKMSLLIPKTLATNQGTFDVASVQKAFFSLDYHRLDTIISKSEGTITNEIFQIKKGRFAPKTTVLELDNFTKELELHFILSKKGKYYIQVSPQSGRLEMTDKDGTKYLIMFNTGFNVKDSHHDVFLESIGDLSYRAETQTNITSLVNSGFGWYVFIVE